MCILLFDCTNTIAIRLKNNGTTRMVLQIIQCNVSKNQILGARKEKLVHEAGHVNDEGRRLLEIDCILGTQNGVSNKLL